MSYDPHLPTDKDKIRLLIGDTDTDEEFLTDSEIQHFLETEGGDLNEIAAACAEAIAAKLARDVNYRASTLWSDAGEAHKHFLKLADRLKSKAKELIGLPVFESSAEAGEYPDPYFKLDMHENPTGDADDTV